MAESTATEGYGRQSPGSGSAGNVKAQLGAAAEAARDKVDSVREPIADKLRDAAETLHDKGQRIPGAPAVAGAAQGAADYIESHSAQQMIEDIVALVKKHPTQSLLVAGTVGFLIARAFRRD